MASFSELATTADPPMDRLAVAVAAAFHAVDEQATLARLDALGDELAQRLPASGTPLQQGRACALLLGATHGFAGDSEDYDHPRNSMLDGVLERRRGLPILLSVLYAEVGRRAGVPLRGVGLPGHFVVGHFGCDPPVLLDPFAGGTLLAVDPGWTEVRPWPATEIAMRMLNNLFASYRRRGDLAFAIRAGRMRLELPVTGPHRETLETELRALQARLN